MWPFGFQFRYPYTDFHQLNSDWIIEHMKQLEAAVKAFMKNWSNPVLASSYTDFVDRKLIYLYTGDEVGYQKNYWYYFDQDTNEWTAGGLYGSAVVDDEFSNESLNAVQNRVVSKLAVFVTPQMFGAEGDGIHDDTEAFTEALSYDNVFIPEGDYLITNTIPVYSNCIRCVNAKITFNPAAWKREVFYVYSDDTFYMEGLHVNASNLAAMGINFDKNANAAELESLKITGCSFRNMQNLTTAVNSAGIFVNRKNLNTDISNNVITEIRRNTGNPGVIASVAIHVNDIMGSCSIHGNNISGVYYDSTNMTDADGIQTFVHTDAFVPGVNVDIYGNDIRNCQGRFIKIQGETALAHDNTCSNDGIEIMESFVAIDAQTGKGDINNNIVNITNCTGGYRTIMVKVSGHVQANNYIYGNVTGNKFYSNILVPYVIQCYSLSNKKNSFHILDNVMHNFTNGILIAGDAPNTLRDDVIILGNSFYDYTRGYLVQNTLENDSNLYILSGYNTGSHEDNNIYETVIVPSSVTAYQDVLKTIADAVDNNGPKIIKVIWTGHEQTYAMYSNYDNSTAYQITWYRNDRIYTQVYTGSAYYTYEFDSVATLPDPTV